MVLSILFFGLPLNAYLAAHLQPLSLAPAGQLVCAAPLHPTLHSRPVPAIRDQLLGMARQRTAQRAAYFGVIAPGAILLNMLLVNLAALVICAGVLALGCGLMQLTALSAYINHAAWVCLSLMDALVRGYTLLPGAVLTVPNCSTRLALLLLTTYLSATVLYQYALKRSSRHWIWLAPGLLLSGMALNTVVSQP